jgi:hypothetical protein
VLVVWVNALTLWLTLATFVGYAIVYTLLLKPMTPQNIVIGGASGAMPPVLGWAAMRGEASPDAWLLCLIIFLWTPPHFWALALYRTEDYRKAGLPMLPVTHGPDFTEAARLPLHAAAVRGHAAALRQRPERLVLSRVRVPARRDVLGVRLSPLAQLQRRTGAQDLRFSILYLSLLFAALWSTTTSTFRKPERPCAPHAAPSCRSPLPRSSPGARRLPSSPAPGPQVQCSRPDGAQYARKLELPTSTASSASSPISRARSSPCSSAIRSARRLPDDDAELAQVKKILGPDAPACRSSSSPSTPSATPRPC